ncbi:GNAT family N-acetyltransferase [Herbiconiux sp. P15]|uniref:GNAT family N-acetyltransferase n=1 Tax=Herbiconiux liukaitaii TaxID=3342799 RepID=UPI0035B76AFD
MTVGLHPRLLGRALRRPRFLRGSEAEEHVTAETIRTPRLTLRPYAASDAAAWYDLQSAPEVLRYLDWPARDREASRVHLLDRTRHTRLWQADDILALAVEHHGELIGDATLQLRAVAAEVRTVEIGWIVHPRASGRGIATEASLAMIRIAFDSLHAKIVTAVIRSPNTRSLAMADRLGFQEMDRSNGDVLMVLNRSAFMDHLAACAQLRELLAPRRRERALA